MREAHPGARPRLPRRWNDTLIALSARSIGAVLVTHNGADFRLLGKHLDFELEVLR